MAGPILFISTMNVVEGKGAEFAAAFGAALDVIGATKPRTALMAAFRRRDGNDVRIVHAFPDAEAMTLHFVGSEARTAAVAPVMRLTGFEVYGEAPSAAIAQLQSEAGEADIPLLVFDRTVGGFLRPPA